MVFDISLSRRSCFPSNLSLQELSWRLYPFVMGRRQFKGRPGRSKKWRLQGNQPKNVDAERDEPVDLGPFSSDASITDPASLLAEDSQGDSSDSSDTEADQDSDTAMRGCRLFDLECLAKFLNKICCDACHGPVVVNKVKRHGLVSEMQLYCRTCGELSCEPMSKQSGRVWETNRRAALAMTWIGRGHAALVKASAALNMPAPMNKSSYQGHLKALATSTRTVATASMKKAAAEVREQTGVSDVAVSYGGTWMRRGFSSMCGAFIAISWDTGKFLDFQVLSRFVCNAVQLTAS